jgi:septum formation topological specificity factor MinE
VRLNARTVRPGALAARSLERSERRDLPSRERGPNGAPPVPPPADPPHQARRGPSRLVVVVAAAATGTGTRAAAPATTGAEPPPARTIALGGGELATATSSAVGTSIRYRVRPGAPGAGGEGGVRSFLDKLWLVWQVFFPERPAELTPKDGAKQRLRMILVADRCGLSPSGLAEMKRSILLALEDFVDIESEEEIDVTVSVRGPAGAAAAAAGRTVVFGCAAAP